MPIIEGADMTSISTDRELLPEGDYLFTILGSEMSEDGKSLIIKRRIEECDNDAGQKFVGQESWDWLRIKGDDGKVNTFGLQTLKRYLEAVFGKDSQEANNNDSDPLDGHQIRIYVVQKAGKKKEGESEPKMFNNGKSYRAA